MLEIDKNQQKSADSDGLDTLLRTLTVDQLRYVVARQECSSDQEAAKSIGISRATVGSWGEPVKRAVQLMAMDGVHVAMEILRRSLPKAMAIKAAGLDSEDERVRQAAATEIIDRHMGKAVQKNELSGKAGGPVEVVIRHVHVAPDVR